MYGHLNIILKKFLQERFGNDAWTKTASKADCPANHDQHKMYDDSATQGLLDAAVRVTGLQREALLLMLGEYYLEYVRHIGHDELLRNLGDNMLAFIENLDYVHTYMMSEYPDVNMPSFRCESDSQKDKMVLHYYSFREGYHFLVIGILTAVAKVYFRSEIEVQVISKTTEQVANQKGTREHVILAIRVTAARASPTDQPPPTFVAQTKKHAEKQIHKADVEHVMARLEQIRRDQGEEALPLNRLKVVQSKWKSLAKMSVLYGGFVPQYPSRLSIDAASFCNAFPYHVTFNEKMNVIHSGVKMQKLMPDIRSPASKVDLFFDLLHPHSMTFNFENVRKFINTPFVLRTRSGKMENSWGKKPMVVFRGQMVYLAGDNMVIYLCSPFVRCIGDLEQRQMYVADIPIHDVTRDMLWMELMTRYKNGCGGSGHPSKQSESGGLRAGVSPMARFDPGGNAYTDTDTDMDMDVDALRRELAKTQAALREEKAKNQWLYYAFLPPMTAQQIADGKQPDSGHYKNVSVLFSDVVSFASIITHCKPHDAVNVLTQLHSKFHRVCLVHETYRVEAIGDAYMVMSGAPEELTTHAQRIANTALGLLISAREVVSPYDYGDNSKSVKIRIGVHTGAVVCGVVGGELPRFMAMGDTVNLASKMESHGEPGKIHISQATHDRLKKSGYKMEKRGKVDIRGRGRVVTYFLLSNEKATDADLVGRGPRTRDHDSVEVTFMNEGREVHPPNSTSTGSRSPLLPSNKIRPLHGGTPGSRPSPMVDDFAPMPYSDSPRYPLEPGANVRATAHRK